MTTEYSGNMVGSTCSYKSLCNYNSNGAMALIPQGVPDMATQVVPNYKYPPPYNTLSHGKPYSCGGKFNLKDAYPCTARDKTFSPRCCTTSPAKGADCWKCPQ